MASWIVPSSCAELLDQAALPVHQPAARFAYLRRARTIALEARDVNLAVEACEKLESWFEVDGIRRRSAVLTRCFSATATRAAQEALANRCLQLGFAAIAQEDYRFMAALNRLARVAASKTEMPYLIQQAEFMAQEAEQGEKGYQRIAADADALREKPNDPAANLAVGQFLCLIKNDWERGLAMLKKSSDPTMQAVASQEMAKPASHEEQVALGDLWWDIAETGSKNASSATLDGMRRRARYWYLKALGQFNPGQRADLATRVQPRIDAVPSKPIVLRIRWSGEFGNHKLRFSNDGVQTLSNTYGGQGVQINHLHWPKDVAGKNTGATRLYPDAVDFTTTDIKREAIGRWGSMRFSVKPDEFVIRLHNATNQRIDSEMTIAFQSQGFTLENRFDGLWDVKFYNWKAEDDGTTNDFFREAGWESLLAAGPVNSKKMDRIDFREGKQPFEQRGTPPSDKVAPDYCAMAAESDWTLPAGVYEVRTMADDGVRVFIGDQQPIKWPGRAGFEKKARLQLTEGTHKMRVHWYQLTGPSRLQFSLRLLEPSDPMRRVSGGE